MTNWTSGYVADIGYTFGYYAELNPLRTQLTMLHAGVQPPKVQNACELGFGQGVSIAIHAAANPSAHWCGTDFNPSQAAFARQLAADSGLNANLQDDAFAEFCAREDLPQFDYIGLHGIWSWISDDNRQVIVDFLRRKLAVGGVVYISYNTLPGWSAAAPLRQLMTQFSERMTAPGAGMANRIDAALGFTEKLIETKPQYFLQNPLVAERFGRLKGQNRNYLAHEYFNRDWHPMYFAEMANWLQPAKLSFAASANFLEHVDAINLNQAQQELIQSIADPDLQQTVRDYAANQQFRKDYWVRGAQKLEPMRQGELLREHRVILTSHRPDIALKVQGYLGEASLNEGIYNPLLDLLADHQIRSIGDIESALVGQGINLAQIVQALMVLSGMGHISSVQNDDLIALSAPTCQQINGVLLPKARSSAELTYLASPVTGGGVIVPRFQQLFLLAIRQGLQQPQDWAQFVWQILAAQGQAILKEGKTLPTPEENLAELNAQANDFANKTLPILNALRIG